MSSLANGPAPTGRGDLGRGDLGRGDLGRGDLGRGATEVDGDPVRRNRRAVLAAVGGLGAAVVVAGCQTYGADSAPAPKNLPADGGAAGSRQPEEASADRAEGDRAEGDRAEGDGDQGAGGEVLASLADVPVGGGVIFAAKGVVLTCPKEGTVKAFSVNCPHAGCAVNQVSGGTINCPCHGSKFAVEDGSVTAGPARKGLDPVRVSVNGDAITLSP